MYKKGLLNEGQLGVLAKAVLCSVLQCDAKGPEVLFGRHVLRLADSLPPAGARRGGPAQGAEPSAGKGMQSASRGQAPGRQIAQPQAQGQGPRGRAPLQRSGQQQLLPQPARSGAGSGRAVLGQPQLAGQSGRAGSGASAAPASGRPATQPGAEQKDVRRGVATQPLFSPGREGRSAGAAPKASQGAAQHIGGAKQETQPIEPARLEELVRLIAKEVKADVAVARTVLASLADYLSAYPSVGILRLIDDITRKTKADARVVRAAVDALRDAGLVEVIADLGVVNLKR